MERYILMIIAVLVFFLIIKRRGFSKFLALGAIGVEALIFGSLFLKQAFSPLILMEMIPWFFICYSILYFIKFCWGKSVASINGIRELNGKRKRFKERQKVASTNTKVKTYTGAKKKK